VSIADQPLRVLEVLVEHAGVVVSREQLRARLWPADTFVDFEHGLNAAVKRVRDALGDSADHPRFIETVPKRGYRFVAPVEGLAPPPAEDSARLRGTRLRVLAATAVLAVILASVAGWRLLRPTPAPEPASTLRRLTFDSGLQTDPTVSPDGTLIAYASNQSGNFEIWVRPLAGGDPYPVTSDPADDTQPDWSPDGKWIAFRSERTWADARSQQTAGGLFRVSVADRRVERISPYGYGPRISPDGAWVVFGASAFFSATYYLAAADGTGAAVIAGAPSAMASRESTAIGWHPGGRLVFLHGRRGQLRLSSLAPGARTAVEHPAAAAVQTRLALLTLGIADREPLAWSADGRTLYFVAHSNFVKNLWQLTVDPASLTVVDGPRRVTTAGEWDGRPAAMPGGGVAFASSTSARRVWLLRLDASGRVLAEAPTPATPPEWNASQPALSPDGREMMIQVIPIGGSQRELRLVTLDGSAHRRVRTMTGDEFVFLTHWSPDGRRLLYGYRFGPGSDRRSSIRLLDLATLQESNVTSDAPYTAADNPWGWSRDGASVLANGSRYVTGSFALVRLPLAAAPKAEARAAVLVTSAARGLWNASESPDGRWVCYNATDIREGRDSALYVAPAAGGAPRPLTTGDWDDYPRWSGDGRFVYFVRSRGGRIGLWGIGFDTAHGVADGAAFEIAPFTTFQGSIDLDELGWSTLSVAGSRVAVPLQYRTGGIWLLH
jgi:Tol biopolymer transport system component